MLQKECPPELEFLYSIFLKLSSARGSNGFGFSPIPFHEIWSWSCLHSIELSPWEISIIRELDSCWLSAHHARLSRTGNQDQEHGGSSSRAKPQRGNGEFQAIGGPRGAAVR